MKKIEIIFRKLFLTLLLLTRRSAGSSEPPVITKDSKILFIRLNRIGDALVSTPLLKEIKEQIGCKIYILASSNNYFVFENQKLADEIIVYRKNINSIRSLIKIINNLECDAIVDLHDDVSSTVSYLIAFSKSRYKFGLNKKNAKLFTHTVNKLDSASHHVIKRVMEFGKLFNLDLKNENINIVYEPQNYAFVKGADDFLVHHFADKNFLLGINISAGSKARFWGIKNYKQLISDLSNYNLNILLLCAENDINSAMMISQNRIPIYYRPTFDEFCAMIPKLDFLFTPDTSIVHVASAFKIPVFGLYVRYNTKDMIWSPYKSEFDCVITEDPNLANVSYDSVYKKFIPLFEKIYFKKELYELRNT